MLYIFLATDVGEQVCKSTLTPINGQSNMTILQNWLLTQNRQTIPRDVARIENTLKELFCLVRDHNYTQLHLPDYTTLCLLRSNLGIWACEYLHVSSCVSIICIVLSISDGRMNTPWLFLSISDDHASMTWVFLSIPDDHALFFKHCERLLRSVIGTTI